MKIRSVFIKDFQQFKDFELDLTYPKGHPKEGKPLDKVCIIGQSGTGKTTLLKFLEFFTNWGVGKEMGAGGREMGVRTLLFRYGYEGMYSANSNFQIQFDNISESVYMSHKQGYFMKKDDNIIAYLAQIQHYSITISADQNANFDELEKQVVSEKEIDDIKLTKHITISPQSFHTYWTLIKDEAKAFQINLLNKRNEFSKLVTNLKTPQNQIQEEVGKLREWEENQINPLKKLADECLDKLLNQFNLKVKTEVDFEDIGFIKVETLQGKEVSNDILSTGVKQILLTALPLYALKPEKSVILFDEPERSLYPDIQTKIIDFYTNLVKDCQFFFATHSPLIASCFEPWEIVELKFKEDGTVYRELYYDINKENHVDNYFINPQYLRWDSILQKVFDLDQEGNPERIKKLMELATLRSKLQKENGSLSATEKSELVTQFEKLADLLDWNYATNQ